jgi:hypothetical protein
VTGSAAFQKQYLRRAPAGGFSLTKDGSETLINGTFDWVYEELNLGTGPLESGWQAIAFGS